jgi:hypothetical protein
VADENTARLWDCDGKLLAMLQGDTAPVARQPPYPEDGARSLTLAV